MAEKQATNVRYEGGIWHEKLLESEWTSQECGGTCKWLSGWLGRCKGRVGGWVSGWVGLTLSESTRLKRVTHVACAMFICINRSSIAVILPEPLGRLNSSVEMHIRVGEHHAPSLQCSLLARPLRVHPP